MKNIATHITPLSFIEDPSCLPAATGHERTHQVQPGPFLSIQELQDRWNLSHMTIARLRKDGKLRAHRFGVRGIRFSMEDILKFEAESAA